MKTPGKNTVTGQQDRRQTQIPVRAENHFFSQCVRTCEEQRQPWQISTVGDLLFTGWSTGDRASPVEKEWEGEREGGSPSRGKQGPSPDASRQ